MVIGIVVNVMERENEKARAEKQAELIAEQEALGNVEPTLKDVMAELNAIKAQLSESKSKQ